MFALAKGSFFFLFVCRLPSACDDHHMDILLASFDDNRTLHSSPMSRCLVGLDQLDKLRTITTRSETFSLILICKVCLFLCCCELNINKIDIGESVNNR